MNKIFRTMIWGAALAVAAGFTACVDDLDSESIDPNTAPTPDFEAIFNKCYASMGVAGNGGADGDCDIDGLDGGTTGFVRQMWNANSLTTDEAICSWGDEGIGAFNFNTWGATHPMLQGFYYRLYFGITMCNYYLSEASDVDAAMTAEVRFLRALYYYHLMDCFGNVPFTTTVSSENASQYTRKQLFDFIESELLDIEGTLKAPRTNTYGRADKAAAWILLSRLYLNAEVYTGTAQWQKAAEYADKVMQSDYKLFTNGGLRTNGWSAYQMLFMGNNGENGAQVECILPVLQDGATTTSYGTTMFLMCSAYQNSDMTINGKLGNGTTEEWKGNRCRRQLIEKFFPDGNIPSETDVETMVSAAGDDRALFWSKGRTLDIEQTGSFVNGYSCSKFNNHYSTGAAPHDPKFPDSDFFLFRVAEAYLTYAEATARQNGGTLTTAGNRAISDLRSRAHAKTQNSYTLDDICDEWAREFYFEGMRRPVLIRFGRFGGTTDYQWQWKGGAYEGANFDEHFNIFAIPATDLNANDNLTQNPGY